MIIKLVIFLLFAYFGFKAWKAIKTVNEVIGKKVNRQMKTEIDEDLVKDPFCQTYFQKRDGIHHRYGGEDIYFCSHECKEKFLASRGD